MHAYIIAACREETESYLIALADGIDVPDGGGYDG
jgi:hypothetical protein